MVERQPVKLLAIGSNPISDAILKIDRLLNHKSPKLFSLFSSEE
jgi:hypothetical protein